MFVVMRPTRLLATLEGDAMALTATKAEVWAVDIDDRAGGVADKLDSLAKVGASFDQATMRPLLYSGGTTHFIDRSCAGKCHVALLSTRTAKSCIITVAKS